MKSPERDKPEDFVNDLEEGFPFEACMMLDKGGNARAFKSDEKAELGIETKNPNSVVLDGKPYQPYGRPASPIRIRYE